MTEPTYGVTFEWRSEEVQGVAGGDFSGAAYVGPAPGADAAAFPLDTPVALYSTDSATIAKLGTQGYLRDALEGGNDQLGTLQRAGKICIVRTAHSTKEDAEDKLAEELAAIAGDSTQMTGIHALKGAASEIGWTPRLVNIPGYTHQSLGAGEGNPVVADLPSVLERLLGVAVIEGPTGKEAALAWRETFAHKRLIPVVGGVKVATSAGTVLRPLGPRLIGIAQRRDHEKDGMPFHSFAGQTISGIVAPGWEHDFSLTDGANEGQDLLAANLGIVEQGEQGVDDAIADAGFYFVGTDHADTTIEWPFYHQTRGNDWIWLSFLKILRQYKGRYNLTIQVVQSAVNMMNRRLRDLVADEHLYRGTEIRFDPDANSVDSIRSGKITLDPKYEIPSVWRRSHLRTSPRAASVELFIEDLAEALEKLAA